MSHVRDALLSSLNDDDDDDYDDDGENKAVKLNELAYLA